MTTIIPPGAVRTGPPLDQLDQAYSRARRVGDPIPARAGGAAEGAVNGAIAAIILREKERFFDDLILTTPTVVMSVVSVVEALIVLTSLRREVEVAKLDETLAELRTDILGVDSKQGTLARTAFQQYGKGEHRRHRISVIVLFMRRQRRVTTVCFQRRRFLQDRYSAWRP
jgi:uncharacterized protein with PIN domain